MKEKWIPVLENSSASTYYKKGDEESGKEDLFITIGEKEVTRQTNETIKKKSRNLYNRLSLLVKKRSSNKNNQGESTNK